MLYKFEDVIKVLKECFDYEDCYNTVSKMDVLKNETFVMELIGINRCRTLCKRTCCDITVCGDDVLLNCIAYCCMIEKLYETSSKQELRNHKVSYVKSFGLVSTIEY